MLNRNLHRPVEDEDEYDLTSPPEADLPVDPQANSLAMLGGTGGEDANGAMLPSEAGPTGEALAGMGMMVQGAQLLSAHIPGFVPVEVTAWLQQGMQLLPQLLQQMQSGLGAQVPGMGQAAMMGQMGALAPAGGSPPQQSQPSGPPRQQQY